MSGSRRVVITIDRLVVDNVGGAGASALNKALTAELERRLATATSRELTTSGSLPATVGMAPAKDPAGIGRKAGMAVARRLTGRRGQ